MRSISVNNIWMHNASDYWMDLKETLDEVHGASDIPRESTNVPMESWECKYCQFETICK
jgi:CRISPR/Cas system-associated exonuclease Cas4 (RecB family)